MQTLQNQGVVPSVVFLMTKSLPFSSLYTRVHCPCCVLMQLCAWDTIKVFTIKHVMEKVWVKLFLWLTDKNKCLRRQISLYCCCYWIWNIGKLRLSSLIPICPAKFWGYITRQFTLIPLVYGWYMPHQEYSNTNGLHVISARLLQCLEGAIYSALLTHHVL